MTKHITRMEIDDAEHFTPEERQAIIDAYPEHEREARTKGIPSKGLLNFDDLSPCGGSRAPEDDQCGHRSTTEGKRETPLPIKEDGS